MKDRHARMRLGLVGAATALAVTTTAAAAVASVPHLDATPAAYVASETTSTTAAPTSGAEILEPSDVFRLLVVVPVLWIAAGDAVKVRRFRRELDRWDGHPGELSGQR